MCGHTVPHDQPPEDLNPYLSLEALPDDVRASFLDALVAALWNQLKEG